MAGGQKANGAKATGKTIKVKVHKLMEKADIIEMPANSTVDQLVKKQGLATSGKDFMINGEVAKGPVKLYDGAILTLAPRVKGGC